jgi:hypothetical protein
MLQVRAESFIPTSILPGRRDLGGSVAEHGAEPMFAFVDASRRLDLIVKFFKSGFWHQSENEITTNA